MDELEQAVEEMQRLAEDPSAPDWGIGYNRSAAIVLASGLNEHYGDAYFVPVGIMSDATITDVCAKFSPPYFPATGIFADGEPASRVVRLGGSWDSLYADINTFPDLANDIRELLSYIDTPCNLTREIR